jgi:hypothetical protein
MAKKPDRSAAKIGRPKTPHEREQISVRLRSELMALIREEMLKQRPMPDRNDMVEVLIEDGLIARGYKTRMPWLGAAADAG